MVTSLLLLHFSIGQKQKKKNSIPVSSQSQMNIHISQSYGLLQKMKDKPFSKFLMQQACLFETYSKCNFQVRLAGAVKHNRCAEITSSARTLIPQLSFTHLLFLSSF